VALARGRTFDVVTQVQVTHAWLRLRDSLESAATAWYLAELADRSMEERHEAEGLYALLRRAYELLDAGMDAGPGRALVRDASRRRAGRPAGSGPLRRVRPDARGGRKFRWVPPLGGVLCSRCPGPPADRVGLSLDALKLLKAYQRMDVEALAGLRLPHRQSSAKSRGDARFPARFAGARRPLARVPRRGQAGPRSTVGLRCPAVGRRLPTHPIDATGELPPRPPRPTCSEREAAGRPETRRSPFPTAAADQRDRGQDTPPARSIAVARDHENRAGRACRQTL
jgi:hypothetical protein